MKPSSTRAAMAARQRKSRARRKAFAAVFDTIAEPTPPPKPPDIPRPKFSFEEPPVEPMVVFQPDVKQPLSVSRVYDTKLVYESIHIPVKSAPPEPPPPPARPLTHAERVAPASTAKPMSQWTMAELEAHKAAHRAMYSPQGDARGTLDWFIRACAIRNMRA